MKKILILLIMTVFLLPLIGCLDEEVYYEDEAEKSVASGSSYTFMVYMNGTDLESEYLEDYGEVMGAASEDLMEMMEIGSSEDVNVVVETLGTNEWLLEDIDPTQNQRWLVQEGYLDHLADLGNHSVGDPDTLVDFIVWSVENYPADKYVLDFWNHGGGPLGGFGLDEQNNGESLTLPEISEALDTAYELTGVTFEVIGFDACLMGSLETAYAVAPYANYFIASEELEPGHGWYYTPILSSLVDYPEITGEELGEIIADGFLEQATEYDTEATVTLSVTDLSKMDGLMEVFDELFAEVSPSIDAPNQLNLISQGRSRAESYGGNSNLQGYSDLIDLAHFAENISSEYELAEELLYAMDEAVIYSVNGSTRENSNGLSIYFPHKDKENFEENLSNYSQLDFSPNYQDFVHEYVSKVDSTYTGIELIDSGFGEIEDEEAPFSIQIDPEDLDMIEYINCFLAIYLDEEETEIAILGMDNNVNFDEETGIVSDNFSGWWTGLDGHFVSIEIIEETDDYNRYVIPVLLNGEEVDIVASWFWDDSYEEGGYYEVNGAWRGFIGDSIMPDKNLIKIKPGDSIIPLFEYYDEVTDEDGYLEGDEIIVGDELVIEDVPIPSGSYLYGFYLLDYAQNEVYSDFTVIELEE